MYSEPYFGGPQPAFPLHGIPHFRSKPRPFSSPAVNQRPATTWSANETCLSVISLAWDTNAALISQNSERWPTKDRVNHVAAEASKAQLM
jgi:hypothetical protein